jgi:hypothetical protein
MNLLREKFASLRIGGWLVFGVAVALYYRTAAPGLTFVDSGELATVATRLGIAHPTGYPLFTLLGWMVTHLPFGPEAITRLNLMAAFCCAAAAACFYNLFLHLLTATGLLGESEKKHAWLLPTAAFSGALLLAFSETFWSQAVAVEVYSLHLLLISTVLLTFFRALLPMGEGTDLADRHWSFFAFALGLSFANHMTTILLGLGLLYLYFAVNGWRRAAWTKIGRMSPFFLLGLSPYVYLPVRASEGPFFNWGAPATIERFLWHVSGKQYRVWIFSSTEAAGKQFHYFLSSLPSEFGYIGLVLAIIGVIVVFWEKRKLFWGTVILFVSCVGYSINYDIHDIDSYFLLAYICVSVWATFGIAVIIRWLASHWDGPRVLWQVIAVGLVLPALLINFGRVDQSKNHLVEDYTIDMFASFAPDALVLSYQWDYWVSASLYVQYVRGYRTDVAVVDKELLRRSWYLKELEVRYPWLVEQSRREIESFRRELYKFEHGLPYEPGVIQVRFEEMIRGLIRRTMSLGRPVYVTSEIEPEFTREWQHVPVGLAVSLHADTLFHPSESPVPVGGPSSGSGTMERMINRLYAEAFVRRAQYYYHKRGYSDDVSQALNVAGRFDEDLPSIRRFRALLPHRGGIPAQP